ncbi:hypothetical protein NC652_038497 [Populus alba x Populus x berolinensis]|nr:hypothetical protein NC652_038497 [Populus alba x Populus x berolinensis]
MFKYFVNSEYGLFIILSRVYTSRNSAPACSSDSFDGFILCPVDYKHQDHKTPQSIHLRIPKPVMQRGVLYHLNHMSVPIIIIIIHVLHSLRLGTPRSNIQNLRSSANRQIRLDVSASYKDGSTSSPSQRRTPWIGSKLSNNMCNPLTRGTITGTAP